MPDTLIELETEHLCMRTLGVDKARQVLTFFDETRAFLEPWEPKRSAGFYTLGYQREYLRWEQKELKNATGFRFWLYEKDDSACKRIVGSVSLNNVAWGSFSSSFIGYRMHGGYVNKGYMTEAVARIRDFAFESLRLHRLEACIMPRNTASRRVVEKLGFVEEGLSPKYMRINGVWEDHLHYVCINECADGDGDD